MWSDVCCLSENVSVSGKCVLSLAQFCSHREDASMCEQYLVHVASKSPLCGWWGSLTTLGVCVARSCCVRHQELAKQYAGKFLAMKAKRRGRRATLTHSPLPTYFLHYTNTNPLHIFLPQSCKNFPPRAIRPPLFSRHAQTKHQSVSVAGRAPFHKKIC